MEVWAGAQFSEAGVQFRTDTALFANANFDASEMLYTRFRECPICFSSPRAVKFIQRTMLKVKERFGAADPNQLLSNVSAGTCSIPASDVSSGT